jgi:CheY-like chemotaxis protein
MIPLYATLVLAANSDTAHPAVIIVDDDPSIVSVVCDFLSDEGVGAASCPYGRLAHACIRAKQPQVALLDIQMPEVDGIALFKQLRADPQTQAIPVIFVTANAHLLRTHLPDYEQRGAALVPKPFDLDDLLAAVERHLNA